MTFLNKRIKVLLGGFWILLLLLNSCFKSPKKLTIDSEKTGSDLFYMLSKKDYKNLDSFLEKNKANLQFDNEIRIAICYEALECEEIFRKLITSGINFESDFATQNEADLPSLNYALRAEAYESVQLRLDRRYDPNSVNPDDGTTPLHEAASMNNTKIVKLLLKHGANINQRDFDPYLYKTQKSTLTGWPPLWYSLSYSMAKFLIASGADLVLRDSKGE